MKNWFKKSKKVISPYLATSENKFKAIQRVEMKQIDYPAKIILAWAKAIEGNNDLLLWLKEYGYPELTMATYAIYLKEEARNWLLNNGYPQLMAFINAAEGNEKAQIWLQNNDFETLYHMALAIENEEDSWKWLGKNVTPDMFILTQSIKKIKDKIEENHNDVHSFGKNI